MLIVLFYFFFCRPFLVFFSNSLYAIILSLYCLYVYWLRLVSHLLFSNFYHCSDLSIYFRIRLVSIFVLCCNSHSLRLFELKYKAHPHLIVYQTDKSMLKYGVIMLASWSLGETFVIMLIYCNYQLLCRMLKLFIVCCINLLHTAFVYCILHLFIAYCIYLLYAVFMYCILHLYSVCRIYLLYAVFIYCILHLFIVCCIYLSHTAFVYCILHLFFILQMKKVSLKCKKSLKIPKGQSKSVNRRRTDSTMVERKKRT